MNFYEQKLSNFIKTNNISAELLIFETSCHSVEEAAQSANASVEDFVKNICIMDENRNFVVAIIHGPKKLDLKKLSSLVGSKVRFASAEEVLEKTGYPAGGTPSFGYVANFFIDKTIIGRDFVLSGGGSQNALTKTSPAEIIRISKAKDADLVK